MSCHALTLALILTLSTDRHDTGGFFIAVLHKNAAVKLSAKTTSNTIEQMLETSTEAIGMLNLDHPRHQELRNHLVKTFSMPDAVLRRLWATPPGFPQAVSVAPGELVEWESPIVSMGVTAFKRVSGPSDPPRYLPVKDALHLLAPWKPALKKGASSSKQKTPKGKAKARQSLER